MRREDKSIAVAEAAPAIFAWRPRRRDTLGVSASAASLIIPDPRERIERPRTLLVLVLVRVVAVVQEAETVRDAEAVACRRQERRPCLRPDDDLVVLLQ